VVILSRFCIIGQISNYRLHQLWQQFHLFCQLEYKSFLALDRIEIPGSAGID
jgi:hypothetical protein